MWSTSFQTPHLISIHHRCKTNSYIIRWQNGKKIFLCTCDINEVFIHWFTVTNWFNIQHCTVAYDSLQTIKYVRIVCLGYHVSTMKYRPKSILVELYRNVAALCACTTCYNATRMAVPLLYTLKLTMCEWNSSSSSRYLCELLEAMHLLS